jgi:hypothetical protein
MSASEEMMREQIDSIIVRTERRCEQQCSHANALASYGNEAKRAKTELALLLAGLAKLKTLRSEFSEPQQRRSNSSPGNVFAG